MTSGFPLFGVPQTEPFLLGFLFTSTVFFHYHPAQPSLRVPQALTAGVTFYGTHNLSTRKEALLVTK